MKIIIFMLTRRRQIGRRCYISPYVKIRHKSGHHVIYQFSRRSRAAKFEVRDGIWLKLKLVQAFMHVLITCKNEADPIKVATTPIISIWKFFRCSSETNSAVSGQIRPNFELKRDLLVVLVAGKNEDPIKNEGALKEFATQIYGRYLLPWKPDF